MSKQSKILLGILGAAAAGVIAGMLIAPDKGSETRKKIKNKAKDYADNLNGVIEKGKRKFQRKVDEFEDVIDASRDLAEEKVERMKKSLS